MTDKTIDNIRKVGGDYFRLYYSKQGEKKLDHYLSKFNPDDYWIYKSSRHQRLVTYEDLLEFKYACYILFKKELYDKDHINMWIDKLKEFGGVMYLVNPVPPIEYLNKINIL